MSKFVSVWMNRLFVWIGRNFWSSLCLFTVVMLAIYVGVHLILQDDRNGFGLTQRFVDPLHVAISDLSLGFFLSVFAGIALFRWQNAVTDDVRYKCRKRFWDLMNAGYIQHMQMGLPTTTRRHPYAKLNTVPQFENSDIEYYAAFPETIATQNFGFWFGMIQDSLASLISLRRMKDEIQWRHFVFFFVIIKSAVFQPIFMFKATDSLIFNVFLYTPFLVLHLALMLVLYQAEEIPEQLIKRDCAKHEEESHAIWIEAKKTI